MKKILILHNKYREIGGEDIAVQNEIKFLQKFYEVDVLYFENSSKNFVVTILSLLFVNNSFSNKKIRRKIVDFKPDLVYIHNTWFILSLGFINQIKKKKIPILFKLHNFRYSCTKTFSLKKHLDGKNLCQACGKLDNKKSFFNKYYQSSYIKSFFVILHSKKFLKILMSNEHKISLLTEFQKSKLKSLGIYENNIKIIPNPIIFEKNKPKTWSKEVIYAGRVSEEKGITELIDTFESSDITDYTLKIIGDGPLFKKLNKNKYQKTILLGRLDNETTLKHIENSSIVITATKLYEGQPTILSEASSLGIPCIFPISGGIEEFFPKNYEYSFVQFDYEKLAKKIKLLTSSENKVEVGAKNYEFLKKKLEESQLISNFEEIF